MRLSFPPRFRSAPNPPAGMAVGGQGPVRSLLLLIASLVLLGGNTLFAQEQESRMKRILEPDQAKSANIQSFQKSFQGKDFNTRSVRIKEFHGAKNFRGKDFATSDYNAVRRSTLAEKKHASKTADTNGRGGAKRLVKEHEVSTYGVKEAQAATKTAKTKTYDARETQWRGTSQDQIDREGPAAMASIQKDGGFRRLETIDDVRKLLNELD